MLQLIRVDAVFFQQFDHEIVFLFNPVDTGFSIYSPVIGIRVHPAEQPDDRGIVILSIYCHRFRVQDIQRHRCQIQESHEVVYPRLGDIPIDQSCIRQEPSFKQILPLQLCVSINMPRHRKTVIILEYIVFFQDGHKCVIQVLGEIKFVIRFDRIVIRTCPIDCQAIKATINV